MSSALFMFAVSVRSGRGDFHVHLLFSRCCLPLSTLASSAWLIASQVSARKS